MKDLDTYLDEAIKNIREDRAITATLLTDLVVYLRASDERHREVGGVAAKYVETLQRSNEQLVKIAALIQKKRALRPCYFVLPIAGLKRSRLPQENKMLLPKKPHQPKGGLPHQCPKILLGR